MEDNILKKILRSVIEFVLGFIYVGTSLSLICLGLSEEDLSSVTFQYFFGNRILVLIAGISMFVVPYLIWRRGRKNCQETEEFDTWMMTKSLQNPTLSLEDALNQYIFTYNLAIRHDRDEPERIVLARTKIHVLERTVFWKPENMNDEQVQIYLEGLKTFVTMYEKMSPEAKSAYKKREKQS